MPDKNQYHAHSLDGKPPEEWQPLEEHLHNVANLAARFAEPFGGEEWAYLAGLWHDLGKYSEEFQDKLFRANGIESHLETKPGKVVHSYAGGHLAQRTMPKGLDRVLCWLIMGHHAGLADFSSDKTGAKALEPKMRKPEVSESILGIVPKKLKEQEIPKPPTILTANPPADVSLLIRMLFSCVVDADFLDTEAFMNPQNAELREPERPSIAILLSLFESHMAKLCHMASPSDVNRVRARILEQCRESALLKPAVFSLTVPTGGGKTLSSLAFALRHAEKWQKRRIIYVIPYTSIIEQTAKVFRDIPGFQNVVLEHHSNIAEDDETKESVRRRLAAENWDAPIVVTTSVQFFESLYACKTSRSRKLHNIANSVVIFDEAQCLPPAYLRPAVFAIRELQQHYSVTPVLCTATQPVLTQSRQFDFEFKEGFESVTEIVREPGSLSRSLERIEICCHANLNPVTQADLAKSIKAESQNVLCIVNRKRDCRELATLLPEEQTVHLSTNMCARHRLRVLARIRERLKNAKKPLYVVSTSLVEAGVDLDFPVVYRALAGLDSIAQAAGRCNREGKLNHGKTVVFLPEIQPDYVSAPASLAREYLTPEKLCNALLPETFESYFKQRFFQLGSHALDEKNIMKLLGGNLDFYFRTVATSFRLIDDSWQLPIIVPYDEAPAVRDKLLQYDARSLFRRLQQYIVNAPKFVVTQLLDHGHACELIGYPGTYYLHDSGLYSDRFGFTPPDEIDSYDPKIMIT